MTSRKRTHPPNPFNLFGALEPVDLTAPTQPSNSETNGVDRLGRVGTPIER
jgi:hypothetical protein